MHDLFDYYEYLVFFHVSDERIPRFERQSMDLMTTRRFIESSSKVLSPECVNLRILFSLEREMTVILKGPDLVLWS